MRVREAKLSDLKNLSVLFNSYRMFYGKKSDLKVAKEFLRSRIEKKDSKIFVCDFNNELSGFPFEGHFVDAGTPESYIEAVQTSIANQAWISGRQSIDAGVLCGTWYGEDVAIILPI